MNQGGDVCSFSFTEYQFCPVLVVVCITVCFSLRTTLTTLTSKGFFFLFFFGIFIFKHFDNVPYSRGCCIFCLLPIWSSAAAVGCLRRQRARSGTVLVVVVRTGCQDVRAGGGLCAVSQVVPPADRQPGGGGGGFISFCQPKLEFPE